MKKTRIEDFSPKELAKLRKGRKGSAWQISSVAFAFLFALLAVTFSLLAFDNEGDEGLKIPAYAFFALAGVALAIFFIPKYFPKSWVRSLNRSLYRGIFSSDLQDFDFPVDKDLLVERGLEDQVLREVGQDARFDYGSTSVTIVDVVKTMSARDALEREAKGEGDSAAFLDRFASPFCGALILLEKPSWRFPEVELRSRGGVPSTTSFSGRDPASFWEGYDVYAARLEDAQAVLDERTSSFLKSLSALSPGGAVFRFSGRSLSCELRGVKLPVHPIPYGSTKPLDAYEEKKRKLGPCGVALSSFLSSPGARGVRRV